MFQLWKLVLVCGLLTGASASLLGGLGNSGSLLGGLGNDLGKVVNSLKPVVENTLDTVDHTLQGILGSLRSDLKAVQESKIWQLAKQKFLDAEKMVNDALSHILSYKDKLFALKISNVHIVDVKVELTSDGKGLTMRFPSTADVSVALPVVGKLVDLKASLDLLTSVRVETNAQTGASTVVLTECASDPASISLSLLDGQSALVNEVVDTMTSFLSNTVSFLVQKQMCPLIRLFLSTLDPEFVTNTINKLQQGAQVQIHV